MIQQALASAITQASDDGNATALSEALSAAYASGGCGAGAQVRLMAMLDLMFFCQ